jgi:signal transduction histidine kinase/ligand-binding sensor domain-containing protein
MRFCATLTWIAYALAWALPVKALDPNKAISQFTHTSWSAKDGIPGPVAAIAQTPDGYLWFGTNAGLYRFDGQNFVSWEPAGAGDKLPRSAITALLTARDGSLWIGYRSSAVSRLQSGILRTYTPADGLHAGGTLSLAEDRSGSIWAGGASGFSRFVSGQWSRVGSELGYRAPGARQLLVDRRGVLWVATDGFHFGLNTDSVRVNTILKLPLNGKRFEATGQPVGYVAQLAEAPDGEIWMAEASDPHPTVRAVLGRSCPNVERAVQTPPLSILFDGQTGLWIGLLRGGIRRATDFKHLEQTRFDRFESKDGLSGDGARVAFKDREGNLWFGTNRGLDRFRENKATPLSVKEGLSPNPRVALASTQDGKVWIVNSPRDLVQRFFDGRIINQTLPPYSPSDSTRVLSVYSDKNRVWLGGSFSLAEGIDGRFSYLHVPGTTDGTTVEAITSDSSGDLWIEIWEGDKSSLKRLRKGEWTDFRNRPELPRGRCRVLFGDAAGRVWLGFETGDIVVYDNDHFRRYSVSDGLPGGKVLSIAGDRAGHIWVAGEGGLSQFDGRRFVTLTKENGLPGSSVSAILEDDDGSLWIAGGLGIIRVRPQELQNAFKSSSYRMQGLFLDTTDGLPGLPSQEEPFPSATKSADGRLWFVTTDGIALIDPHRLPRNTRPPPIVIQTVTADNRRYAVAPQLHFPAKMRNLEIGFAALSFSIPERVLCRYKLEGYDSDWRGAAGTRLATYTNLAPRRYRFRVIGGNDDGVWNEGGATLEFDIAPAFYQTNWFLLLCGMVACFLLWLLYRWRLRFAIARLDLQHSERLSERERIARELHDTLLQSIQGLMLRFQAVAKQIPDDEPARLMLEKALDRADEVMAEGRGRVTGLRTFDQESDDLSQAFSKVAQEFVGASQTTFRVVVEGTVRRLHPMVRDEAYRIGREALINAFLHAHSRGIEVEICYSPKELRIRIQDNGRGIDSDVLASGGKSSHWGLRGMTERAKKIRGRLGISSRVGVGTEIELKVPGIVAYDNGRRKSDRQVKTPSIGVYKR